jgi:hypothetical protein
MLQQYSGGPTSNLSPRAHFGKAATAGTYQQAGHLSVSFLLVGAAQVTLRSDPEWRSEYLHLATRTQDRQGTDGPRISGSSVLDVE